MARPLRIEYPGALYHVSARGNAKQDIFLNRKDRLCFLEVLHQVATRFNLLCHCYCLMGNHYHLMVETPEGNLSAAMRQLNGVYSQSFNRRHGRVGHVFQGRYKAILVEREAYLLELSRYIVRNPQRAQLVERAEDWEWSSYRATLGWIRCPAFLIVDDLLSRFGNSGKKAARLRYRAFVEEGEGDFELSAGLSASVILGTPAFVESFGPLLRDRSDLKEIPRIQRHVARPGLSQLFATVRDKDQRNRKISVAYLDYGYTMKEIADALGLHYTTISHLVTRSKRLS
ncbi:MAG: transposase [Acidobacteriota bacterium]|nr:transposase [Acidobacteriota bacterium]